MSFTHPNGNAPGSRSITPLFTVVCNYDIVTVGISSHMTRLHIPDGASSPKGLAEYNAGMVRTQGRVPVAGPNVANDAGPLTFLLSFRSCSAAHRMLLSVMRTAFIPKRLQGLRSFCCDVNRLGKLDNVRFAAERNRFDHAERNRFDHAENSKATQYVSTRHLSYHHLCLGHGMIVVGD